MIAPSADSRPFFGRVHDSIRIHEMIGPALADATEDEVEIPPHFSLQRRAQFAAGRHCARQSLHRLGVEQTQVGRDDDGKPLWPQHVVGSISHTDGHCIAAVAPQAALYSIGVDVEKRVALSERTMRRLCTPAELEHIRRLPADQAELAVLLHFSAKESLLKCVMQHSGVQLACGDSALQLDWQRQRVEVERLHDAERLLQGNLVRGYFTVLPSHVMTCFVMHGLNTPALE